MVSRRKLVCQALATALLIGTCACAAHVARIEPPAHVPVVAKVDTVRLRTMVEDANAAFVAGKYEDALERYQVVLRDYRSLDGALEMSIQTNMALCCMEVGDREGFLHWAAEVRNAASGLPAIPQNTQLVLLLENCLVKGCSVQADTRINDRLSTSMRGLFEGSCGD